MIKILGIIPARSGSKGIPGKNIKILNEKPLIHYSVISALQSNVFDKIILTTDSNEIVDSIKNFDIEVPFIRPTELSLDDTPMVSVVTHAVDFLENNGWTPDIIFILQPTSPLRQPEQIKFAVDLLIKSNYDSVVSVVEVPRHFSPDYVMKIENGNLLPFLTRGAKINRRQDARKAYSRDGTIYAFWNRVLKQYNNIYGNICFPLVIPSSISCNLDSFDDWEEIERKIKIIK